MDNLSIKRIAMAMDSNTLNKKRIYESTVKFKKRKQGVGGWGEDEGKLFFTEERQLINEKKKKHQFYY